MITAHTTNQHADSIADYLPNGPLFIAKKEDGSKMRALLIGLAVQILSAEGKLVETEAELDINTTTALMSEWESALGIPDSCFSGTGTIEDRRRDVLIKLSSSVQTEQDFVDLAFILGVSIQINSGITFSTFPLTFPWLFFSTEKEARFTMVVDFGITASNAFPLVFPFMFDDKGTSIIRCIFSKLKPANVNIIYREVM